MTDMPKKPVAAIVGAGPAGLSAALGLYHKGWDVHLYERYAEVKAAGNILNLWPTPQKALRALGASTENLGVPAYTQLRRYDGRVRAEFRMPEAVAREYNGGFIGLIRWGLYKRMIDALPEGVLHLSHKFIGLNDRGDSVQVEFEGREPIDVDLVVGADGIDSAVRKAIWGDSPKRYHGLHLMGGGSSQRNRSAHVVCSRTTAPFKARTRRSDTKDGMATSGGSLRSGHRRHHLQSLTSARMPSNSCATSTNPFRCS